MTRAESEAGTREWNGGYAARSMDPLPILVFLLPLILFYEIGSAVWLMDVSSGSMETIRAHRIFNRFFELFGVGGAFLPGVAMIVVLFVWQTISRKPWRVRAGDIGLMTVESAAWTLPLLVLGQMAGLLALAQAGGGQAVAAEEARSLGARLTIAIGAGLYEELLFRMVAIALLHFILVDLIQMKEPAGRWLSIAIAAAAFALYHDDWSARWVFLFLAGIYFGGIYVYRGFGIVVGAHALYDIIALST